MSASRLTRDAMLAEFSADESIVLDVEAGRYHQVNATGSFIWKALENDQTDDEIVEGLVAEFDVSRERATASLRTFLDNLASRGFLKTATDETFN